MSVRRNMLRGTRNYRDGIRLPLYGLSKAVSQCIRNGTLDTELDLGEVHRRA
jgi:hypothetical protein